MIYIEVLQTNTMEQIQSMSMEQSFDSSEEQVFEKSIGNHFEEFLSSKNRLAEFDELSQTWMVSIDGSVVDRNGVIGGKSFSAKVSEILKMVVNSTQKLRFLPRVAGG